MQYGGDWEVAEGVRLLREDLRRGYRDMVCADAVAYYRKLKAVAAVCYPYFYRTNTQKLLEDIAHKRRVGLAYPSYPGLPGHGAFFPLPRWLADALTFYGRFPDRKNLIEGGCEGAWVLRSFFLAQT